MSSQDQITAPATVMVIGLGNMGQPMSKCLMKAGFDVIGFDMSEVAKAAFAEAGGRPVADLAAASNAQAVITLLPDGKVVRTVVDNLRQHLQPGAVLIEMSSSEPVGTRELAATLTADGFGCIDAPVSGGVRRAVDGSLTIMVGGEADTLERVRPVLSALGASIIHAGAAGAGHAIKALNNFVSAAGLAAAVEAIEVGRAFGLDPVVMTDVLNASTGRNNSTEVKLKPFIIPEKYNSGFLMSLMAKDVRTADNLARAIGVPTPMGNFCADLWDEASSKLGDGADHTEIARYVQDLKSEK